ncbi:MAG TPA: hypothetical protein VIG24_11600 [Acidimicrobiia bacterium]
MKQATGYQLGSQSVAFAHLGTFATADDAHDTAEVLEVEVGRTYYLHVLLADGSTEPVIIHV